MRHNHNHSIMNLLRKRANRRALIGASGAAALFSQHASGAETSRGIPTAGSFNAGPEHAVELLRALQPEPAEHVQAVVSAHQAATEAGMDMLARGGTAADAAVAVAAALTVVQGWFSSVLGGGTWALYYDAASEVVASLDGVGPAGSQATPDDYAARAGESGIHQSIVPGAWDGWMLWLAAYGRLDLGAVLEPAIRLARDGFPASASLVSWATDLQDQILSNPASARVYAPDGVLPNVGDTIYMSDLADTFEDLVNAYNAGLDDSRLAAIQAARDYFYRGPLAEAIVEFSDENGGYLTLDDFNDFTAMFVDPISIDYDGGITVYENPPNSQGITMLLGLNTVKEMGLSAYDINDADAVHVQIEAMKLAFADRHAYIGDPERTDIPIEELLSEEYAAEQRARIDLDQAMEWPIDSGLAALPDQAHTTTFQIVDREGNAASVTTSLGAQFLVIGDTGIHMNNRMRMFSVEEGNPNELAPGQKVRHTSCPYMSLRDARPYILGGNTGVDTQPQAQFQQFLNVVEFGLGAQEAVDRPRWVTTAFPSGTPPWEPGNQLQMQRGFPSALLDQLRLKGHDIVVGQGIFGQAGMLIVNSDATDAQVGEESALATASGVVIPAAP